VAKFTNEKSSGVVRWATRFPPLLLDQNVILRAYAACPTILVPAHELSFFIKVRRRRLGCWALKRNKSISLPHCSHPH
jgi:hypothetical protein